MLKIFPILIAAMFSAGLACAEPIVSIDALGTQLKVLNPDSSVWREAARRSDPEFGRGMLMFKHAPLKDPNGISIQPVLSVVYEQLPPDIKSAIDYAKLSQLRTSYPVLKTEETQNTVIYYCHYNNGMEHRLTIAYRVFGSVAVQFIADTTESVLPLVQTDIQSFIASASHAFENSQ